MKTAHSSPNRKTHTRKHPRQIDTRWFQQQLKDREIRQWQIAKYLHLDPAAVSLMFRGKRKMTLEEANGIASNLSVPIEEVLEHAGIPDVSDVGGGEQLPVIFWADET
jgi:hypothetical protein